jgi:thioredoxin-related protein
MKTTSIVCAAAMALIGTTLAGGEGWTSDFEAAKKQAAESGQDLLIDFTGSDWCGWCIKLKEEVFDHDPFKEGVKDKFVLVELDFPRDKSKQSEELQARNKELSDKYAVRGFPTILLADAQGRPFAQTGYQPGGPEKYVEHLDELRSRRVKRDEFFAAAEKAEGPEKAKAYVAALDAMKLENATVTTFYGDVVEKIKESDPDDTTGFGKKAEAKARAAKFEADLEEFGQKQDMDGALALVDKTLEAGGLDPEDAQKITLTRAMIFAQQQKFDEAIKVIDEAKAVAPESDIAGQLDGFKERLAAMKEQAAQGGGEEEEE